eukprot:TRINITY_DN1263_c0_g2_i1.p1 TRINITY_DN1263_c0_g2~~TRINITY_DN1263_c0_g2_i1.p1  ORF type:complete len:276 (-),score=79.15 TRINITY_DN1263_c0_g2_i1:588-1415(-)
MTQEQYIKAKNEGKVQKVELQKLRSEYSNKKKALAACSELMDESAHYSKHHPSAKTTKEKSEIVPKIAFTEPLPHEEGKGGNLKDKLKKNEDNIVEAFSCFHKPINHKKAKQEVLDTKDDYRGELSAGKSLALDELSYMSKSIDKPSDLIAEQEEANKEGMWTSEYNIKLEDAYETSRSHFSNTAEQNPLVISKERSNETNNRHEEESMSPINHIRSKTLQGTADNISHRDLRKMRSELEVERLSSSEESETESAPATSQHEAIRTAVVEDVSGV